MNEIGYTIIVEALSPENGGGYLATIPELPGCMGDGETYSDAVSDVLAAIEEWKAEAEAIGREVPKPGSSLGQWRQRVPRSLHARLKRIAQAEGVSLNALAATALADFVARHGVGLD